MVWAVVLTVLPVTEAEALYLFDDLLRPSGQGPQWMVVTSNYDTGGAPTNVFLNAVTNIVEARNPVLLMNGGVTSATIDTLFLVLPARQGTMTVSFDASPPYPAGSAYTQDVQVDNAFYAVLKTPVGQTSGPQKAYQLDFVKNQDASEVYESVRGNFIFHQNPNLAPSQSLQVPFIIANVYDGTAEGKPLLFKAMIRDSVASGGGNIAAYDRFEWSVIDDETPITADWVFVPIPKLPTDSNAVYYRLSTEITNRTAIRYALHRYDGVTLAPSRWAFDIPTASDIPSRFDLDELSHIPPGLVTTYNQSFNVVSGVKDAFRMYPIDPNYPAAGFRNLTLTHRSIFGLDLGTFKDAATPSAYIATGFQLLSAGADFLSNVGKAMGGSNAQMPDPADGVMSGAVSYAYIASDVIASLGVEATVPGRMAGSGLLPLHITFNVPRSNQLLSLRWNALLEEWRKSGNIRNLFANAFCLYLQDSHGENLNLTEWLQEQNGYDKTVKVFLDEQRNVLTISFIVMMMDSAKDSRAAVRLVNDTTPATSNSYIVAADGVVNGKWDMKVFVAPARAQSGRQESLSGSGSGGGCDTIVLGALLVLFCVPVILKGRSAK
jgi:hypothetical protein